MSLVWNWRFQRVDSATFGAELWRTADLRDVWRSAEVTSGPDVDKQKLEKTAYVRHVHVLFCPNISDLMFRQCCLLFIYLVKSRLCVFMMNSDTTLSLVPPVFPSSVTGRGIACVLTASRVVLPDTLLILSFPSSVQLLGKDLTAWSPFLPPGPTPTPSSIRVELNFDFQGENKIFKCLLLLWMPDPCGGRLKPLNPNIKWKCGDVTSAGLFGGFLCFVESLRRKIIQTEMNWYVSRGLYLGPNNETVSL